MGRWSPARLAKTGFVIFVPLEVARLVSGGTFLGPWTTGVIWLGQALIIAGAVWAALAWPGWTRLVRALLGLLFLMVPVWPWFTLYVWDAGAMPTEALLRGVDPAPFLANIRDDVIQVEYLQLIESSRATFPASPSGCVVPRARGGYLAIVSLIDADTHRLVWAAIVVGLAVSAVGAAVAAWNLFGLSDKTTDRAWVVAMVVAVLVIGALLLSQTVAVYDACNPPTTERNMYRLHLWTGLTLHPFGPALLLVACFLTWYWPRAIARHAQRAAQLRLALKERAEQIRSSQARRTQ